MKRDAKDIVQPTRPVRARLRVGALAAGISIVGTIGVTTVCHLRTASPESSVVGVVEPIAMIEGWYYDDGGSRSIRFRDAAGVTRYACLLNEMEDGRHNLIFEDRELSEGGAEEKAFLELLERWANSQRVSTSGEADREAHLMLEELRRRDGRNFNQPTR